MEQATVDETMVSSEERDIELAPKGVGLKRQPSSPTKTDESSSAPGSLRKRAPAKKKGGRGSVKSGTNKPAKAKKKPTKRLSSTVVVKVAFI